MTPDPTRDSGSMRLVPDLRAAQRRRLARSISSRMTTTPSKETLRACRNLAFASIRVIPRAGYARGKQPGCRDALPTAGRRSVPGRRAQARSPGPRDLRYRRPPLRPRTARRRASEARRSPGQAIRSRRRELAMVGRSDVTFVVSDEERDILGTRITCIACMNGSAISMTCVGRGPDVRQRRRPAFRGRVWPPTQRRCCTLVRRTRPAPGLREAIATIVLHVAGDIDEQSRRAIDATADLHGRVEDLTTLLGETRLSVAPLRFGAGVKGKVNQAMSHGLPVVLTTIAAEGMHLVDGVDALIADEPARDGEAI